MITVHTGSYTFVWGENTHTHTHTHTHTGWVFFPSSCLVHGPSSLFLYTNDFILFAFIYVIDLNVFVSKTTLHKKSLLAQGLNFCPETERAVSLVQTTGLSGRVQIYIPRVRQVMSSRSSGIPEASNMLRPPPSPRL